MPPGDVHALIPCRAGSQRVPKKNTRSLPGYPGGLLELKLLQLTRSRTITSVVLSTDDPDCIEVAQAIQQRTPQMKIRIVERPAEFAQAGPLDPFIDYVAGIMPLGVVAWLHVTSPFFDAAEIDRAVNAYRCAAEAGEADSLMGVSKIQTFLWDDTGCVSHDRARVKWPQTQDLRPIYEVNSTIFLIERNLMAKLGDRISDRVLLYEVDRRAAFDVDWPADFEFLAQAFSAEA